jgi:hypothetical protein
MMTIHLVQSGPSYVMDNLHFSDEEALIISLRARGVTHDNIMQALEAVVWEGTATIAQA